MKNVLVSLVLLTVPLFSFHSATAKDKQDCVTASKLSREAAEISASNPGFAELKRSSARPSNCAMPALPSITTLPSQRTS